MAKTLGRAHALSYREKIHYNISSLTDPLKKCIVILTNVRHFKQTLKDQNIYIYIWNLESELALSDLV